jgi:hypothetical protein
MPRPADIVVELLWTAKDTAQATARYCPVTRVTNVMWFVVFPKQIGSPVRPDVVWIILQVG